MIERLVVVGASLGGLRAAQAARNAGHDGGLVVIGRERHLPYTRPPLSKELLCGTQTSEEVAFALGELDVDWRLGVGAVALDRAQRRVLLADGESVSYDRVIVATGCRARQWQLSGSSLAGVHTLRELEDAQALQAELLPGRRLVIVGAGFIGCEVAASARGLGVEVTLIDIASHPLSPFGPQLGQRWLDLHRQHGVDVRLGVGLEALRGAGRVQSVELSDGTLLDADVVLIALGSELNTEWLAESGLELNPGVVCDATLTTTRDPDVLAAGDVASVPVALAGGVATRIEHWTTAAEHGQLAGRNALLEPDARAAHLTPPYFWSDQYDTKIQAIGCPALGSRTEIVEETADGTRMVAASVDQDGRVLGVVAVNAAKRLAWYRRQFAAGVPPALAELKQLLSVEESALGSPASGAPR
jgi:3-phenylpropionate/trans-cinnamate dioxygenase ferredoxin reductase subunit